MNMPKIPENFSNIQLAIEPTEDEKIDRTINAALDSVWVIDNELSKEYFSQDSYNILKANVGHLEIVLNSENIKNSNRDLTKLQDAVTRGKTALGIINNTTVLNSNEVDAFIQEILNEQSN